jgi:hypothetical protein
MEETTNDRCRSFMIEDILGPPATKDDSESASEAPSPASSDGTLTYRYHVVTSTLRISVAISSETRWYVREIETRSDEETQNNIYRRTAL